MQKKAYLSIISAAALWGCIGVFLRLLTAAGLDSMESGGSTQHGGCHPLLFLAALH